MPNCQDKSPKSVFGIVGKVELSRFWEQELAWREFDQQALFHSLSSPMGRIGPVEVVPLGERPGALSGVVRWADGHADHRCGNATAQRELLDAQPLPDVRRLLFGEGPHLWLALG